MSRPNASGGGGMTGATGDITPDDADEPFVPAELREISDPEHQAEVTTAHGRAAPAQHGEIGSPGESDPSGSAPRDAGYGSGHGLSPADPAYRMESRPRATEPDSHPHPSGDGDEFADHEEHF
jgi:hypothetical protein